MEDVINEIIYLLTGIKYSDTQAVLNSKTANSVVAQ